MMQCPLPILCPENSIKVFQLQLSQKSNPDTCSVFFQTWSILFQLKAKFLVLSSIREMLLSWLFNRIFTQPAFSRFCTGMATSFVADFWLNCFPTTLEFFPLHCTMYFYSVQLVLLDPSTQRCNIYELTRGSHLVCALSSSPSRYNAVVAFDESIPFSVLKT